MKYYTHLSVGINFKAVECCGKGEILMNQKIALNITQTHINTLQNIISRHANYSLNCKTWCITMTSALGVILFEKRQCLNIIVILFPIIIFFLLDCYYLGLERLFKDIYEEFICKLNTDTLIEDDIIINSKIKNRFTYFLKGFISFSTTPIYLLIGFFVYFLFMGV
jgi:hypothetical protein